MARVLATGAQITLLTFSAHESQPAELHQIYERIVTVPRTGEYSFAKILRGAFGRIPLPLLNYATKEMDRTLARVLGEGHFDLVQIESIHLSTYVAAIRSRATRARIVCDWHNVESELMRRYSEEEENVGRRMYSRRTARLMNDAERRALVDFDAHLVVSERDAALLRSLNADAEIAVIENGVDVAAFSPDTTATKNRLVFVGSMDYHANINGVVEFVRHVWPRIHAQQPALMFTIVGKDPAPAVRALASTAGVEVTGSVADVRPYYREAAAAVVPLNVGGGSRLKILEAMAAGVPVVSTARGAEGLAVQDQENILLADSIDGLAEPTLRVVTERRLRERLTAAGRALVTDRYDWSKVGGRLLDYYRQMLSITMPGAGR